MQSRLFHRETGDLSPRDFARSVTSDLVRSFAYAPQHSFSGQAHQPRVPLALQEGPHAAPAHVAGVGGASSVSSLAVDKFDGRILVSGGAEGVIKLWDLEQCESLHKPHTFRPVTTITRSTSDSSTSDVASHGHSHGITHVAFYPFDPDAFLSSSYDKSLKLWSTRHASLSASFDLNATIYSHAMSPIADHVLVACATQHSSVRLVDLKSGSAVQALVAHGGPVLCVAWSPRHDNILVSGHADGGVRVWDVRRAGGVIAHLDQDDSLGILHGLDDADGSRVPRFQPSARAHDEAVNGLQWTDDGHYIVSAGLDRRIRVWDADTGANTLASFGSLVQNKHAKTVGMFVAPSCLSSSSDLLFWPNAQEIIAFDLHSGKTVARMRMPGAANPVGPRRHQVDRSRITGIAWRGAGGYGRLMGPVMGGGNSVGAIYSAHMDGHIRTWMPRIPGPEELDDMDELNQDEQEKVKKRKAVDDAYKSLMGKHIKFT